MAQRCVAVGCPRWPIVAADLPPDMPAAVFFANRVVSTSVAALAWGVRKGMRRREAQARCPYMVVIDNDPARDARTFEPIIAIVETFSPRVEVVRPGLCVLPARGPVRFFGGEEPLRSKIAAAVNEGIDSRRSHPLHPDDHTRVGVADGPFAATLAAVQKTTIERGQTNDFLSGFSVDVLDQPVLGDLLERLGIRTLGDLSALPVEKVVARFGLDGAIAHRLARGDDDRLLDLRDIPPDLVVSRELDPPAHRVDVAMFHGKAVADELASRLGELGPACARDAITAVCEHGEERTRTWRYSAAFTSAAIAERVRWQLEGWLADEQLSGGISILRLAPIDVGPATGAQTKLWGKRTEVSDQIRRAVARVQGLLGPIGARQGILSGGRHPIEQVTLVPCGDPVEPARPGLPGDQHVTGPVAVESPPWPGRLPSPSPTMVIDVPRHVEVIDENGRAVDVTERGEVTGAPVRVRSGGTWIEVTAWTGPWLSDERWWESAHQQARFQFVLADGTAHLLVLAEGHWFVEATYD